MLKFSANLGFLWNELNLVDAIAAASKAGFDAVECHWPFDVPASEVHLALQKSGLGMISLNTEPGNLSLGEFGLSALYTHQRLAALKIDQAIDYAKAINCPAVHVMAGITNGDQRAHDVYLNNLLYACQIAAPHGITILIEPINHKDVPGYHLSNLEVALSTLNTVNQVNLKLIFDCYHIQIIHGEVKTLLHENLECIQHIQIASVPDRHEPDSGSLNYHDLLPAIDNMTYKGYIGAEYKPESSTDAGLNWLYKYID